MKNFLLCLSALMTFAGFLAVLVGSKNVLDQNTVTTLGVVTMCLGAVVFLLISKSSDDEKVY